MPGVAEVSELLDIGDIQKQLTLVKAREEELHNEIRAAYSSEATITVLPFGSFPSDDVGVSALCAQTRTSSNVKVADALAHTASVLLKDTQVCPEGGLSRKGLARVHMQDGKKNVLLACVCCA